MRFPLQKKYAIAAFCLALFVAAHGVAGAVCGFCAVSAAVSVPSCHRAETKAVPCDMSRMTEPGGCHERTVSVTSRIAPENCSCRLTAPDPAEAAPLLSPILVGSFMPVMGAYFVPIAPPSSSAPWRGSLDPPPRFSFPSDRLAFKQSFLI